MKAYILNGKRINENVPFTTSNGEYGIDLRIPANQKKHNVFVTDVVDKPPADYSEDKYFRIENWPEFKFEYIKKSERSVALSHNAKILAQIDSLEKKELLPRIVREFMLIQAYNLAISAGVDPMSNIGYKLLAEFDTKIKSLRDQLMEVPEE